MFRFDHDVSLQGVGVRRGCSGRQNHRYVNSLLLNTSRHRRFTGPAIAGCVPIAQAHRDKNQMSD